jgi:preprotein translocase subunit SecD
MKKQWIVLIVVLALLPVAFIALAIAVFIFLPNIMQQMHSEPRGAVLVYEIDSKSTPDANNVDMARLIVRIDSRLNPGWQKLARVRELPDRKIEVHLYSTNAAAAGRVKRLLKRSGTLEFRILANERDNKDLIEQAKADPSKSQLFDREGNLLAWWAPVNQEQSRNFDKYADITRRTRKTPQGEVLEILLMKDIYDVTGIYLTRAACAIDRTGKPCVNFMFNSAGGQLFGELTGTHEPDKKTAFAYKLAIILDGEVFSAPSIRCAIYDHGEITGNFTNEEAQDLASTLNSGSSPANIRLISKKSSSNAGDK